MAFVLGLIAFGVAIWLLIRLKARDVAHCREILGLEPVAGETTRGTTPEGFTYSQTSLLRGALHGYPATLWSRSVRHPHAAKLRRKGSQFTVLEFELGSPVRFPLRIQPVGILETLEQAVRGTANDRVPIDQAFDAAYVVYSSDPAGARAVLTASVRETILGFRSRTAGNLPASIAGDLTSGLVLGTFDVDGSAARYALFGSPTAATAEQVKAAAPILLQIASAVR